MQNEWAGFHVAFFPRGQQDRMAGCEGFAVPHHVRGVIWRLCAHDGLFYLELSLFEYIRIMGVMITVSGLFILHFIDLLYLRCADADICRNRCNVK